MGSSILRKQQNKSNSAHNIALCKAPSGGLLTPLGCGFILHHAFAGQKLSRGKAYAVYQCKCGKVHLVACGNVRSGKVKSCGCMLAASRIKHGQSASLTYNSWKSMIARCYHTGHTRYRYYGGRGIAVCERWHSFENFLNDMGRRPTADHSIDRYPDLDGGYEPGNCRWATRHEQATNTKNSLLLTIDGRTAAAVVWAKEPGAVNYECILARVSRGWTHADAVFLPLRKRASKEAT